MSDDPSGGGGGGEDRAEAPRPEVIPANPSLLCWQPDLRAKISWGRGAHPRFDLFVLAASSLAESCAVRSIRAGAVDGGPSRGAWSGLVVSTWMCAPLGMGAPF